MKRHALRTVRSFIVIDPVSGAQMFYQTRYPWAHNALIQLELSMLVGNRGWRCTELSAGETR